MNSLTTFDHHLGPHRKLPQPIRNWHKLKVDNRLMGIIVQEVTSPFIGNLHKLFVS